MNDEVPRAGRTPSFARIGFAVAVPGILAVLAAAIPQFPDHPLARAALAVFAGAVPAFFLITLLARTRILEDSVRQLSRGDLVQALPSLEDEALSGMLLDLDALRRMLQAQLRDVSASSEEQERALSSARRILGELAGGVQKQVASVEETAASLSQMSASLKNIAENVEV